MPRSRVAAASSSGRSERPLTFSQSATSTSAWHTWPRACTPASVRPATTRRTGVGLRTMVVRASLRVSSTVRRPGWAAHPENAVPS